MRQIVRYYYDPECNMIEPKDVELDDENYKDDNEVFHNIIAKKIIDKDPELSQEYNEISKSGLISTTIFLVMKGYVYIGGTKDGDLSTMYSSISLNEKTRNLVGELKQDGCYSLDIIRDGLNDTQKTQIKTWAKQGMGRKDILNKVMTDMIVHYAPQKRENKEDFER